MMKRKRFAMMKGDMESARMVMLMETIPRAGSLAKAKKMFSAVLLVLFLANTPLRYRSQKKQSWL